jgi:hypothetical protein
MILVCSLNANSAFANVAGAPAPPPFALRLSRIVFAMIIP